MANHNKMLRQAYNNYICLSNYRYVFWLLLFCFLTTDILRAQTELQDVIIGKADVSDPLSITLKPGFHAKEGSNFHAFIGPLQGQNSSTEITSPTGNSTPASGSSDMNYVKSITYREAQTSIPAGSFKHICEINYFDGLGRPSQTLIVGASPTEKDIIQPILYDSFSREKIKTLPYTNTKSGTFRPGDQETMKNIVNTYYNSSAPINKDPDNRAFTEIGYDNSPLNRVTSQTGPGAAWASKPVTINYLTNPSKPGWSVTGDYSYSPFSYVNTLFLNETIDEDGSTNREYKDKLGQVVLIESKLGTAWLSTSYIYDDFGLLRCVVPPEATGPGDGDLCYYYLYDNRNRMIEKKLPGGGTVKMVYDKRDRLRFTQNSLQYPNTWSYIKYDELNRPVITGILSDYSSGAAALEIAANSTLNESRNNSYTTGYDNASFPNIGNVTVLTTIYYDDYDFFNINGINLGVNFQSNTYDIGSYNIQSKLATTNKGRVTCSMTMVLSDAIDASVITKNKLYSAIYYDKYGNVLRTISDNHLGGRDIISNLYEEITFQLTQTKQEHFNGTEQIILEKWFEYDHTGRLLATREKVNNQAEVTINAMKYNEVGELITKYLHSNQTIGTRTFIQKTDYHYNIRGWLSKINDPGLGSENDMFGMQLFYNSTSGLGSLAPGQGLYNGNIVGMTWGIKNETIKGYQFSYDNVNRLLQSNYAEGSSLNSNAGFNSEIITGYDKNGNIQGLQRKYNNILVDNLDYDYFNLGKSNQLLKITDTGTANSSVEDYPGTSQNYTYDANGNMMYSGAKNFTISYNPTLNLPKQLDFGNNNRIFYHYTANGAKLTKHSVPAQGSDNKTHYIGNVVYAGTTLSYIITDEGRLIAEGTGAERKFLYEYNLKDHLGNNRLTFMGTNLGGAVDIVQTTSYYPFGLVMSQMNGNTLPGYSKNKYLYNGKELQDDVFAGSSLNWFDYGARFYDPQIGRWTTIDPLAEVNRRWSPYTYGIDNPMRFIDPDGQNIWDFLRGVGTGAVNGVVSTAKGIAQMADPSPVSEFKMGMASTIANPRQAFNNVKQSVSNTIQEVKNDKTGEKAGELTGNIIAQVGLAVATTKGLNALTKAGEAASIPARVSRVIPEEFANSPTLGAAGSSDVFVTAAKDIKGITNSTDLATRLTLLNNDGGLVKGPFKVFEFNTPQGIASPINRTTPGFIGRGVTAGGASEYTVPNLKIDELTNLRSYIVK